MRRGRVKGDQAGGRGARQMSERSRRSLPPLRAAVVARSVRRVRSKVHSGLVMMLRGPKGRALLPMRTAPRTRVASSRSRLAWKWPGASFNQGMVRVVVSSLVVRRSWGPCSAIFWVQVSS